MKPILLFSLLLLILASGCSHSRSQRSDAGNQSAEGSQKAEGTTKTPALQNQINEIAAEAKGKVGMSAIVLEEDAGAGSQESGRSRQAADGSAQGVVLALNPHEHFPMQSVYKLPISMAVMKAVDARKIKLADKVSVSKSEMVGRAAHSPIRDRHPNGTSLTVEALLRYALAESDGTASDVLMRLAGGPAAVQAYLTELGIKDMIVLDTEQTFTQDRTAQYRNWGTVGGTNRGAVEDGSQG